MGVLEVLLFSHYRFGDEVDESMVSKVISTHVHTTHKKCRC